MESLRELSRKKKKQALESECTFQPHITSGGQKRGLKALLRWEQRKREKIVTKEIEQQLKYDFKPKIIRRSVELLQCSSYRSMKVEDRLLLAGQRKRAIANQSLDRSTGYRSSRVSELGKSWAQEEKRERFERRKRNLARKRQKWLKKAKEASLEKEKEEEAKAKRRRSRSRPKEALTEKKQPKRRKKGSQLSLKKVEKENLISSKKKEKHSVLSSQKKREEKKSDKENENFEDEELKIEECGKKILGESKKRGNSNAKSKGNISNLVKNLKKSNLMSSNVKISKKFENKENSSSLSGSMDLKPRFVAKKAIEPKNQPKNAIPLQALKELMEEVKKAF